jgi:hypothetical protein
MTIEYRGPTGDCVVMTECPFCGADLSGGGQFPKHLPKCTGVRR